MSFVHHKEAEKKSKGFLKVSSLAHSCWLKLCQNTDIAACRGSIILLPKEFVKDKTWEIRSIYNKVPILF